MYPIHLVFDYSTQEEYQLSLVIFFEIMFHYIIHQNTSDIYLGGGNFLRNNVNNEDNEENNEDDEENNEDDEEENKDVFFDDVRKNQVIDYLLEKIQDNEVIKELLEFASSTFLWTDLSLSLALFFSYDYFILFHNLLRCYFKDLLLVQNEKNPLLSCSKENEFYLQLKNVLK